jgi:hypothetical protein
MNLCGRPGGDRRQCADGDRQVADVELAQKLRGRASHVFPGALEVHLASGSWFELETTPHEAVGSELPEQEFHGLGVEAWALECPGGLSGGVARGDGL